MFEKEIDQENFAAIFTFVQSQNFFKNIPHPFLLQLIKSITVLHVFGGETLFTQGDMGLDLYVVYHGHLRVFHSKTPQINPKETEIADCYRGEILGEMGFLSEYPRANTVVAVRDCVILKIEHDSYKKIENQFPLEALKIAKKAIIRLAHQVKEKVRHKTYVISIAPAGDSDHHQLINWLNEELTKLTPTIIVNPQSCNNHFEKDVAQCGLNDPDNTAITAWLNSLEEDYTYILYETDNSLTPWTARCLRQSDRIIFVAEENVSTLLNSIEISAFISEVNDSVRDLVLIHESSTITGTKKWLDMRSVDNYFHLERNDKKDIQRIIRHINGTSFGVVLNGGGAKGFAHIGALIALHEMNIPIDFIAGCSMGALVASQYAKNINVDNYLEVAEEALSKYKQELAIPIVSIMKGKSVNKVCENLAKDIHIEDLKYPFFCVAANLTQGNLILFNKGPLRKALRSSISMPGIFPPVYNENGDAIVDGGIVNNMPVDILRERMERGKILAINCSTHDKIKPRYVLESDHSSLRYLLKRYNPFNHKQDYPENIIHTIIFSMHLSAYQKEVSMAKQADYYLELNTAAFSLLDFFRLRELIKCGYQECKDKLWKIIKENNSN